MSKTEPELPLKWSKPKIIGANLFLDTNIWSNSLLRLIFRSAAGAGLCRLSLSDYVLEEWIRKNKREKHKVSGSQLTYGQLAEILQEQCTYVTNKSWEKFLARLTATESDDMPIIASARAANSNILVILNYKHFDLGEAHALGLVVYPPDIILAEFLYTEPVLWGLFAKQQKHIGNLAPQVQKTIDNWKLEQKMPLVANALAQHEAFTLTPLQGRNLV